MPAAARLCVVIAARNEEGYIGLCLAALLAQDAAAGPLRVIVAANACTDRTVAVARSQTEAFARRGWDLLVLDLIQGGKMHALNAADQQAGQGIRAYLDADVICAPDLFGQLRLALSGPAPLYATGTLQVAPARTWATRRYADAWTRLPFVTGGAVGAGLFAVNSAGRARWGVFPEIISDDTFVRLSFAPVERIEVSAKYDWPMVEGFSNLIRVRRRQDAGVREIRHLYPALQRNAAVQRLGLVRMMALVIAAPIGFTVYLAVHVAVRAAPPPDTWTRGR